MAWYRYQFCDPSESYNTLCAVPIYSNPNNETVREHNPKVIIMISVAQLSRFLFIKRSGVN